MIDAIARPPLLSIACCAVAVLLAGCADDAAPSASAAAGGPVGSGGAAGSGGSSGPDPNPPEVSLVFPRGVGSTENATTIARGRVHDVEGVVAVHVNGARADLEGDMWTATVALEWGTQPLEVTVEDARGFVTTSQHGIVERAALMNLLGTSVVFAGDVLFALSGKRIVGVRPTGERFVLAEYATTSGTGHIAYDPVSKRILVVHAGALSAFALPSGAKTTLATSSSPPAEASFDAPAGLVVDATGSRAILVDNAAGHLVAVDLESGEKSIFVPAFKAVFDTARATALDPTGARVLVVDDLQADSNGQVLSYALSDGDREVVSFSGAGRIDLSRTRSMTSDGKIAWATTEKHMLVAVDLATGTRTALLAPEFGGPPPLLLDQIAYRSGDLYVTAGMNNEIHKTSADAVALTLFSSNRFPAGEPAFNTNAYIPNSGAALASGEIAYTDPLPMRLVLADGTRTLLPQPDGSLYAHVWDPDSGILHGFIHSGFFGSEVLAIDPANGTEWISLASTDRASDLLLDPTRARLLVQHETGFDAVALTGGASQGVFGSWSRPRGAVLSEAGDALYVLDGAQTLAVYRVDPDTGERLELAALPSFTVASEDTFDLALDGELLLLPLESEGPVVAIDVVSGTESTWNDIPPDAPCPRRFIHFLPDDVVSYGGTCLGDRITGAQIAVAR